MFSWITLTDDAGYSYLRSDGAFRSLFSWITLTDVDMAFGVAAGDSSK